ncbi:hypothetical protein, partial [Nocardia wallacei]|uniref:hypothetical protein n=1 Tax=Nocardia wallacei TaxID=480035 RepID=UPI0024549589
MTSLRRPLPGRVRQHRSHDGESGGGGVGAPAGGGGGELGVVETAAVVVGGAALILWHLLYLVANREQSRDAAADFP